MERTGSHGGESGGKVKFKKCQEVGGIREGKKSGDGFWNEPHQTHVDVLLNHMPQGCPQPPS